MVNFCREMANNHIHCDCKVAWMKNFMALSSSDPIICRTPEVLAGRRVDSLTIAEFNCGEFFTTTRADWLTHLIYLQWECILCLALLYTRFVNSSQHKSWKNGHNYIMDEIITLSVAGVVCPFVCNGMCAYIQTAKRQKHGAAVLAGNNLLLYSSCQ